MQTIAERDKFMGKVIEREKRIIALMIRLYCRHKLKQKEPDAEHAALIEYCQTQLSHCRWQDEKPPCKFCTSHCYAKKQREQVRLIMRWMGPRMVLYAPMEVVRHLLKKG